MDCLDIERALIQGSRPSGSEVEAHLAHCETCRFLVADGVPVAQALAAQSTLPADVELRDLEAATLAGIEAERGPLAAVRALPRIARLSMVGLWAFALCGFFFAFYRRSDWDTYPAPRMWLALASLFGVGLAVVWASLRPLYLRPLADGTRRAFAGVALLVPLALALLPEVPSTFKVPGAMSYVGLAYSCNALGGSLGFLIYLVVRAVDRGQSAAGRLGELAAVGAGIAGGLAVQIHCPVTTTAHLLTGHATIPLVLIGAVLLIRRL